MAKKKDTILVLSRDCWDVDPDYLLWTDNVQLDEESCEWVATEPFNVSWNECFCPAEWEHLMAHLKLKPGQWAKVRIKHLADGDKWMWADNWFYEHERIRE